MKRMCWCWFDCDLWLQREASSVFLFFFPSNQSVSRAREEKLRRTRFIFVLPVKSKLTAFGLPCRNWIEVGTKTKNFFLVGADLSRAKKRKVWKNSKQFTAKLNRDVRRESVDALRSPASTWGELCVPNQTIYDPNFKMKLNYS